MTEHLSSNCDLIDHLSCTLWASQSQPVETAAIFVHGFRGDAERTWRDFPRLMGSDKAFSTWDAYFLGYQSDRDSIAATADRLMKLTDKVFPKPPRAIFETQSRFGRKRVTIREEETSYRNLVLVGHSQGGVVIRKAVLEAVKDGAVDPSPLCNADIVLFAPALFGMLLSGWRGIVGETPPWKVLNALLSGSTSYKEIQVGSQFLHRLQNETEALAQERPAAASPLSARIAWASYDRIVQSGWRYSCDPRYCYLDKDHSAVCKPDNSYPEPLSFVLNTQRT